MKSMVLILTVLALAAPFAANASDGHVSKQYAGNVALAAKAVTSNPADASQPNDPDPDPYVVHG